MLEQTRRQASLFIYVLFGILIATFIYGLAPASHQDTGCTPSSNVAVNVDGASASNTSFLVAYEGARSFMPSVTGRQRVYLALDNLTRRELLAQAAEERGIRTTADHARDSVKKGEFFLGGTRLDVRPIYFGVLSQDDDLYNHKKWKNWVASLNVSESSYLEDQARGLQAAMMQELLSSSIRVSRNEALANYLYENDTVTYDVVAFDPAKYRPAMRLTEADIKRFVEAHGPEVEARYKADEVTYKNTKPAVEVREIFIPKAIPEASAPPPADDKAAKPADDKVAKPADDKVAKPADDKAAKPADDKAAKPADDKAAKPADKAAKPDDKAKPADKKPAAGAPPKPFGLPTDVAKAKLEAVRASIVAGRLTFVDAEKQLAADSSEDAPASNGYLGWRSVENPELGDKTVSDAVKTLKPGEMTPVMVTDRGTYLVLVTAKREGDLSYDQVKNEIATTLAKDVWSKEAAKRDALDALAKAQAGKKLEELFEREVMRRGGDIEDLLNNPNLTPDERRKLLEQFMQRQKQGSLDLQEKDVPVSWSAEPDGSGTPATPAAPAAAGAPAAPATGSPPAAPATGSPPPAAGSATATGAGGGSASATTADSAGAGSAAAPAAPATPPAPTVPTVIEPSKDVLPQFGPFSKPRISQLGPAPRQPKLAGLGSSKEVVDALFDELEPGKVAKKVYPGENDTFVVVQLVTRSQPNVEGFDKAADAEMSRMQEARGRAAVREWLKNRCEVLTKAGKIKPSVERIRETDDNGNPAPTVYRPCMYFDFLGS